MLTLKSINKKEALRYMGHHGELIQSLKDTVDECERRILETARPNFVFKVFDLDFNQNNVAVCGSSLILKGDDVRNHLEGCTRVVLLSATLGADIDKLIRTAEVTDISSAFVMDALASAGIEELCRMVDLHIKEQLPDSFFTWRFSPGYGDFPIDIQKNFLEVLNAPKRIGLCTDENNILIPSKSVTAVVGISDSPLPQKRRGCACCNMTESCAFRKRGDHCGF